MKRICCFFECGVLVIHILRSSGSIFSMAYRRVVRGIVSWCSDRNPRSTSIFLFPTSLNIHPVALCMRSCGWWSSFFAMRKVSPNCPSFIRAAVETMDIRCSHRFELADSVSRMLRSGIVPSGRGWRRNVPMI